ncbi:MAG: hypothetical protein ACI9SP_003638 [Arenicella sp.]|jgi:hypothetical protein
MSRLVLLALIFFSNISNVLAQTTCPGFGTPIENVIYFVNGVDNNASQMRASRDDLRSAVGNTSKNSYDIAENRSNGAGRDFYQALKNRRASVTPREFWRSARELAPNKTDRVIREEYAKAVYAAATVEYSRSPDLREMIDDFLVDLNAGKRVVLVSHSQGNFFANAAYRHIQRFFPSFKDSIGIVAVASPAPDVAGGGFLTQNAEDTVIFGAVNLLFTVLPANVNFEGVDSNLQDHGFLTTYMLPSNARARIVGHVNSTIARLKTPISPCDTSIAIIRTKTSRDIKPSSATLRADLTQGANADVWFSINTSSSSVDCSAAGQSNAVKFTAPIAVTLPVRGLTPNTTYSYRSCAKGSKGATSDGGLVQLITPRNTAEIAPPIAVDIRQDQLDLSAEILAGVNVDVWFLHGLANATLTCNSSTADGQGNFSEGDTATISITGLKADTRYKVVACAKGSDLTVSQSPDVIIRTEDVPVLDCGIQSFRGGSAGLRVIFNMGSTSGFTEVTFNAFTVPDSLQIFAHNTNRLLFSSNGFISGSFTQKFLVDTSVTRVDVIVFGNSNTATEWELTLRCPVRP